MDPITQTLIGAAAASAGLGARLGHTRTLIIGGLGGLLPDADILIRSSTDPLLAVEMHRQFTHSLVFIPIGGAIAALPWMRSGGKLALAAGTIGWATHGLLDACTTYGTQLFWPFAKLRVGWDIVSIVDPWFTGALLIGIVTALMRKSRAPVVCALLFCLAYLGFGLIQRNRALDAQRDLAASRGQKIARGEVFPVVGNRFAWRSLYETNGILHTDRIRIGFGPPHFTRGTMMPLYTAVGHDDLQRFHWFTSGWIAADPADPTIIGDARYSLRPDTYIPVWGVRIHPDRTEWIDRSRQRLRTSKRN